MSGYFVVLARNCLTSTLDYIVTQLRKTNREKGYSIRIESLSKPQRQQQQKRHQTKGSTSRSVAVHVRYKSFYISLPSYAKRQREMIRFCIFCTTLTTAGNFSYFSFGIERWQYIFSLSKFWEQ